MKSLRTIALVASILGLAFLVAPAVAAAPVMSPVAAPTADTPYITAMGIGVAQSSADPFAIGQTLYISAQMTADVAAVQTAADEMVARLDAIKAALVKVGVPVDGIRIAGFSVNPAYGPVKLDPSVSKNPVPPQVSSLSLNGNLTADVPSVRVLVAAMNAATASGATSVSANAGKGSGPYGTVQPSAAELLKATQAAVANARTNAEALTAASGKKLGAIRSIASQLPNAACCPPNTGWMMQVTVTFDVAP